MFHPRNTLVLLRLFKKTEDHIGAIVVPTAQDKYTEAEVVAIGPGFVAAAGGLSETSDLRVGQRVYVQHKQSRGPGQLTDSGTRITQDGEELYLFEQTAIVGVIEVKGSVKGNGPVDPTPSEPVEDIGSDGGLILFPGS